MSATPSVSVITVTYNAAALLPGLIASLGTQTDRRFEWVVVDGASTDATVATIKAAGELGPKWISEPDCGIYDAMNKALRLSSGDYYLVCGADDRLSPDAIENYRRVLMRHPTSDVVVAGVRVGRTLLAGYRPTRRWLGHTAMFTQHSVGTLIKRSLHAIHGDYDLRYRVLADGFFLKTVAIDPRVRIVAADFVAGEFAVGGASGHFMARTLSELWEIQLLTEPGPLLQTAIHLLRTVRYFGRIVSDVRGRKQVKGIAPGNLA